MRTALVYGVSFTNWHPNVANPFNGWKTNRFSKDRQNTTPVEISTHTYVLYGLVWSTAKQECL